MIDPKKAVDDGWVSLALDDDGEVVFTIDLIQEVVRNTGFHMSNTGHIERKLTNYLEPVMDRRKHIPYWRLDASTMYMCASGVRLNLPTSIYAQLVPNPVLFQNGLIIPETRFDSKHKYEGHVRFPMYNALGNAYISPGTTVGRIEFHSNL